MLFSIIKPAWVRNALLAGLPVIQVGHDTYSDLLVRNGIAPSATTPKTFLQAIYRLAKPSKTTQLWDGLGISHNGRTISKSPSLPHSFFRSSLHSKKLRNNL